jgi:hypothetical protein
LISSSTPQQPQPPPPPPQNPASFHKKKKANQSQKKVQFTGGDKLCVMIPPEDILLRKYRLDECTGSDMQQEASRSDNQGGSNNPFLHMIYGSNREQTHRDLESMNRTLPSLRKSDLSPLPNLKLSKNVSSQRLTTSSLPWKTHDSTVRLHASRSLGGLASVGESETLPAVNTFWSKLEDETSFVAPIMESGDTLVLQKAPKLLAQYESFANNPVKKQQQQQQQHQHQHSKVMTMPNKSLSMQSPAEFLLAAKQRCSHPHNGSLNSLHHNEQSNQLNVSTWYTREQLRSFKDRADQVCVCARRNASVIKFIGETVETAYNKLQSQMLHQHSVEAKINTDGKHSTSLFDFDSVQLFSSEDLPQNEDNDSDDKVLDHNEPLARWVRDAEGRRGLEGKISVKLLRSQTSAIVEVRKHVLLTQRQQRLRQQQETPTSTSSSSLSSSSIENATDELLASISHHHSKLSRRFARLLGDADARNRFN